VGHALDDVLELLLVAPPDGGPVGSLEAWWSRHRELASRFGAPADLAIAGGLAADRLGWAFASGYQSAGLALFGDVVREGGRLFALCATESGGAHPKAIETRLRRDDDGTLRLDGHKAFVTLGPAAERLLVLANEGEDADGRKRLRVAAVDAGRDGVRVTPMPAMPFVPEIPHATLELDGVAVDDADLLPGDGWARWIKPFRTVEDCCVHAALLGWLVGVGRRSGWPPEAVERIAALVVSVRGLASADPSSPAVHRALGGLLAASRHLVDDLEPLWSQVGEQTRFRWERDRPLLEVASRARDARLAAARRTPG